MAADARDKSLMRSVVRKVHPDLFTAHPYEGATNSESLKALNSYVDAATRGNLNLTNSDKTLLFYVKDDGDMQKVEAQLPANGSLGPLFYAFGLITKDELLEGRGKYGSQSLDTNFVDWLQQTVHDAVRTADYHESLKRRIRELQMDIEAKFFLGCIQLGGEYALGEKEQLQQIEALKVLSAALGVHEEQAEALGDRKRSLDGLNLRLYHPDATPMDSLSALGGRSVMQSYIGDDGTLHLVTDRATIRAAIRSFDLSRAQLLTRVSQFWLKRVAGLTPPLVKLLNVENVWADTRTEAGSQKFVLWAGAVLEQQEAFLQVVPEDRKFSFSILVHCDNTGPMIDFLAASCVLQVRADSPPRLLLEYLQGESAKLADVAAASATSTRELEEDLLGQVRDALNAKHVIRVCSMMEQDRVLDGARRLLENSEQIRAAVDLTGASIALDDCYEVWESGFISIPYNFEVSDLEPQLRRLLGSGAPQDPGTDGGHEGGGGADFDSNGSAPDAGHHSDSDHHHNNHHHASTTADQDHDYWSQTGPSNVWHGAGAAVAASTVTDVPLEGDEDTERTAGTADNVGFHEGYHEPGYHHHEHHHGHACLPRQRQQRSRWGCGPQVPSLSVSTAQGGLLRQKRRKGVYLRTPSGQTTARLSKLL